MRTQENERQKKDSYFTQSDFGRGGQAWNNGQVKRTVVTNDLLDVAESRCYQSEQSPPVERSNQAVAVSQNTRASQSPIAMLAANGFGSHTALWEASHEADASSKDVFII
jgi:hypothetical protein